MPGEARIVARSTPQKTGPRSDFLPQPGVSCSAGTAVTTHVALFGRGLRWLASLTGVRRFLPALAVLAVGMLIHAGTLAHLNF